MKVVKILAAFLLGLTALAVSLVFPLFKIALIIWVIVYLIRMTVKYKNWTFLIPPIGGLSNLVATLTNGVKMPVLAGPKTVVDPSHVVMTAGTHLKFLCDIFPLWHWGLFSIGDVIIAVIWPLTILGYFCYTHYRKVKNES